MPESTFTAHPSTAPGGAPAPATHPHSIAFRRRLRLMMAMVILLVLVGVNLAIGAGKLTVEKVISESMEPTLLVGDKLLVDANALVDRFSVVVLDDPSEAGEKLVKRIVGIPGDEIRIRHGVLYINGKEETTPYVQHTISWDDTRVVVPPEYIFVMGDNRNNSFDSLNFGPVPFDTVHGVVKAIIWPPSRWRAHDEY